MSPVEKAEIGKEPEEQKEQGAGPKKLGGIFPPAKPAVEIMAEHPVQAGETLSHIALKYYGSAGQEQITRIYEANKDVIGPNPNIIKVGQTLKIPAKR